MTIFLTSAFSCLNKQTSAQSLVSRNKCYSTHYHHHKSLTSAKLGLCLSNLSEKYGLYQIYSRKSNADQLFEGFDEICLDIPWEENNIWSIFVGYLFILHVPLSFGGLSIISSFLHKPTLDPLSIVMSTTILQVIELGATLSLLQYTMKPKYELYDFIFGNIILPKRNWVIKTALGIGFLISLIFLTTVLIDKVIEPKDVGDPVIKEILSQGPISQLLFFYLYCINAPILEEIVYRGFLLSSLGSKGNTNTWEAIILSSCMFSLAHFSFENSFQLFIIGCILGFTYCWSGTLVAPIMVHSIYNAIILVNEIMSLS